MSLELRSNDLEIEYLWRTLVSELTETEEKYNFLYYMSAALEKVIN